MRYNLSQAKNRGLHLCYRSNIPAPTFPCGHAQAVQLVTIARRRRQSTSSLRPLWAR